jgi:hypothetical protein
MMDSGKKMIPFETKTSANTGETPMPHWPVRLTGFPDKSGFLRFGGLMHMIFSLIVDSAL